MYPINLILDNKPCLVLGGGKVAARKVRFLLQAKATVTVIAPQLGEELTKIYAINKFTWLARKYQFGDMREFFLAICATNDKQCHILAAKEAKEQKVLLNVTDTPSLGDFTLPAVYRQKDFLLTVSTNGHSPAFARELRDEIAIFLGQHRANFIPLLQQLRQEAKQKFTSSRARETFWRTAFTPEIHALIEQGHLKEAENKIRHAIDNFRFKP